MMNLKNLSKLYQKSYLKKDHSFGPMVEDWGWNGQNIKTGICLFLIVAQGKFKK
jgi:hypothetical protein